MTFQELLARVREVVLGAYQHQDLPFDMLVEALAVSREANTTPVFQVVFAYQNVPAPEWTFPGLTVDAGNIHNGTAQFELTLVMWETDDGFRGSLEYDTDLFDPETIAQFARSSVSWLKLSPKIQTNALPEFPFIGGREASDRRGIQPDGPRISS